MRCKACDKALSDRESTRKMEGTGEYPDLCDVCLSTILDDLVITTSDLMEQTDDSAD